MKQDQKWNQSLTNLNTLLAGMIPFKEEAYSISSRTGLRVENISFSDKPATNWFYIIQQAMHQEKVSDLIDQVAVQFGDSPVLARAKADVLTGFLGPDSGKSAPDWLAAPESPESYEKIIGRESTLLPVHFLEEGVEKAKSVARIVTPEGIGTGFLIARNLLVTNHHVIDSAETAGDSIAEFNYQKTFRGLDRQVASFGFRPESLFLTSREEDWTVVKVGGDPNSTWGALRLKKAGILKNQRVSIIQHPGGGEKQIAMHHNYIRYADDRIVQYLTDTLNGSSGSPVFDEKWNVVALHHAGGYIREPGTKRIVFRNEGIRINLIIDGLEAGGISVS